MRKINLVCLVLVTLFVVAASQKAQAQRPAHYYPARQPFSQYLLYRQVNSTGIPNYYSFVRPATQFRDFVSRSRPETARRQTVNAVGNEVRDVLQSQLRQRPTTGIGQPAIPATYGETLQFYARPLRGRR